MRPLIEEGRLFHKWIFIGKKNSSEHHYMPYSDRVPKRQCAHVNLVKESYEGLHPAVLQGWPHEFTQHIDDATFVPPSPAGPSGCCPLYFLHHFCLRVTIGMPNRSCILELMTSQCFVCSFLCMPRCKSRITPKKT